ncbi:MAG: undecaprenyldiphospho-muramoylpentapeptide beta-N-acetylglucosaminyltransferase [Nitrospinae bacterium]|nr:undecaprenyldiphospho-muramoylpentapeptide beta-N-acetylglucosaminyltransferase [Nitrospinota bacterium]
MRIVIAAGGTGGHLYPGIAVAQELRRRDPRMRITFIGSKGGLEGEILAREGFAFREITASGLRRRKLREQVVSLTHVPRGFLESVRILRQVRPHMVLGVGGYVAGPLVLAACALRIPRVIHEQNVIPGLTNRLLGRVVDWVAVSFAQSLPYFRKERATVTGNPVRPAIWESRAITREPNGRFHLLLFGGSRGSHRLNVAMVDALPSLASVKGALWVAHQTGREDYDCVRAAYSETVFPGMVRPYIQDMAAAYAAADLVICRAGASTVSELTASGKPAMLVPFPYAANDHQEHNARTLAEAGAAMIVRDQDLTGALLAERIRHYLQHPEQVAAMAEQSRALGKPDAAARVAEICLEVCR